MQSSRETVIETELGDGLDLALVLSMLREWQEANRLARDVQASLPPEAMSLIRSAGVQSREDIAARWVAAVAGLHPDVVNTYAGLLEYVVGVVEEIHAGRSPRCPATSTTSDAARIAELEARVEELETLIAGAAAVLRTAEV